MRAGSFGTERLEVIAHDLIERALRVLSGHTQTRDDEPHGPRRERRAISSSQRVAPESAWFADRHAITPAVSAYSSERTSHHLRCARDAVHRACVSNQTLLPGPCRSPRRKQRQSRLAQLQMLDGNRVRAEGIENEDVVARVVRCPA